MRNPAEVRARSLLSVPVLNGGRFSMGGLGAESAAVPPAHNEKVAAFYFEETEASNGEIKRFYLETNATPHEVWSKALEALLSAKVPEATALRHPAVGIPHDEAERFAHWAGGRLPSEAEWEYAARSEGRDVYPYVWGKEPEPEIGTIQASIDSADRGGKRTSEVKYFKDDRTLQGIYDLTGNVRERCADLSKETKPEQDQAQRFIDRGGSWKSAAEAFATTIHEDVAENERCPARPRSIGHEPVQARQRSRGAQTRIRGHYQNEAAAR
jgi:formylglycine-generating enzyme required for sulfatase activity